MWKVTGRCGGKQVWWETGRCNGRYAGDEGHTGLGDRRVVGDRKVWWVVEAKNVFYSC